MMERVTQRVRGVSGTGDCIKQSPCSPGNPSATRDDCPDGSEGSSRMRRITPAERRRITYQLRRARRDSRAVITAARGEGLGGE